VASRPGPRYVRASISVQQCQVFSSGAEWVSREHRAPIKGHKGREFDVRAGVVIHVAKKSPANLHACSSATSAGQPGAGRSGSSDIGVGRACVTSVRGRSRLRAYLA
jgi:hypothetical protein